MNSENESIGSIRGSLKVDTSDPTKITKLTIVYVILVNMNSGLVNMIGCSSSYPSEHEKKTDFDK